ncbi:hypothetical protein MLPF_2834 [Mycobacterium lepromatosis]|nr:hypothetical protein MLPF_2834 [Mycobacterium lepromatosis]
MTAVVTQPRSAGAGWGGARTTNSHDTMVRWLFLALWLCSLSHRLWW